MIKLFGKKIRRNCYKVFDRHSEVIDVLIRGFNLVSEKLDEIIEAYNEKEEEIEELKKCIKILNEKGFNSEDEEEKFKYVLTTHDIKLNTMVYRSSKDIISIKYPIEKPKSIEEYPLKIFYVLEEKSNCLLLGNRFGTPIGWISEDDVIYK